MRRIYSLDYLKLALAVLVAFGHTYWLQSHPTPLAAMMGNGLMRIIVPLFCIVSGYFFHTAVARGDGMKWLRRVLGLYLIWMAVYLPFWLGQVHDLLSTGPQTVLVLSSQVDGKPVERMIPFVSQYVDGVDLPSRRITVDWQADY